MQRMALVVVEKEISRRRNGESADQAAHDTAAAQSELVGIGEIGLGAIGEPWRAERQLPAVDSCALYIDREEDVGVVQTVVVKKVCGASQKIIRVQDPALE